ncbi:hypothetical protein ABID56_001520 [Alkalibacillus flavidus]|uniref:Uncharacterized protein n=1 Tax=Alkalibacillus flavidus TaxID=546021 RepID=A0ABV2KY02_9BACI
MDHLVGVKFINQFGLIIVLLNATNAVPNMR